MQLIDEYVKEDKLPGGGKRAGGGSEEEYAEEDELALDDFGLDSEELGLQGVVGGKNKALGDIASIGSRKPSSSSNSKFNTNTNESGLGWDSSSSKNSRPTSQEYEAEVLEMVSLSVQSFISGSICSTCQCAIFLIVNPGRMIFDL